MPLFDEFLKKTAAVLSGRHFELIGGGNGAAAVFIKDECPVVYIVSLADFSSVEPESYEKFMTAVAESVLKKNRDILNNTVCVNVLYSPDGAAQEFIDGRDSLRQNGVHNIWWMTDGKTLTFGKGQPDRVFGIEKSVRDAIKSEAEDRERSVGEISREKFEQAAIRPSDRFPVFASVLIAVNTVIFLIQYFSGLENEFISRFGVNAELIFSRGQYYRLFTYMFIHSGWEHILANMFFLFIYGSRFEKYFGKYFLPVYFVSGFCGGLMSAALNGGSFGVGASAAIFGVLGALLVILKKSGQRLGGVDYVTMLVIVVFEIGMGVLTPGVDNFGHAGGLLAGLVCGFVVCGILSHKKDGFGNN